MVGLLSGPSVLPRPHSRLAPQGLLQLEHQLQGPLHLPVHLHQQQRKQQQQLEEAEDRCLLHQGQSPSVPAVQVELLPHLSRPSPCTT